MLDFNITRDIEGRPHRWASVRPAVFSAWARLISSHNSWMQKVQVIDRKYIWVPACYNGRFVRDHPCVSAHPICSDRLYCQWPWKWSTIHTLSSSVGSKMQQSFWKGFDSAGPTVMIIWWSSFFKYIPIYMHVHHKKHIASNDFKCIIFGTLRPGTMETNFLVLFLIKTKNFRMCHPSSKTSFSLGTLWFFLYSKLSCSRKPRTRGCGCPWRPQLRSRMACKIQLMYP